LMSLCVIGPLKFICRNLTLETGRQQAIRAAAVSHRRSLAQPAGRS
jgi:hypothetical protein